MSVSFETLNVVMGYLFVAIKMWAFVDAVTQKKEVFAAVGKQSKLFWSALLGISVFLNLFLFGQVDQTMGYYKLWD